MALLKINELKEQGNKLIVFEAAVLIEAGWNDMVDEILVVASSLETQKQRLMKRNNLSETEALNRINSQMSVEEKRKHATLVLDNDGDFEEFQKKVLNLYQQLQK